MSQAAAIRRSSVASGRVSERRSALITGITGQDGSYLAELLLEKGYEVHGMVRRSSTERFERIEHLRDRITLHQADLLDQRSLVDALRAARPAEIYNLAAMSFVAVSWIQPTLTAEFTGVGVTRMLEAMREVCPDARFYQASSSEMFGKVREVPQNELTPFYPRSPYGVAKAYGHFITVNYRESYDLHATSGILFNHECLSGQVPLIMRDAGVLMVESIAELVPFRATGSDVQSFVPDRLLEVWDGRQFTPIRAVTATRRRQGDADHQMLSIEARGGQAVVTAHHQMLDGEQQRVRADSVGETDRMALADGFPEAPNWSVLSAELAELLGLLCADGSVEPSRNQISIAAHDRELRRRVDRLCSRCFSEREQAAHWLHSELYTPAGHKRVPPLVLNGDAAAREAFLRAFELAAGHELDGEGSLVTDHAVLAQGLCWIYSLAGRPASVQVEHIGPASFYHLNVKSRVGVSSGGAPLRPELDEVRAIVPRERVGDEWVFDLETTSGKLCAGVGLLIVHNSPRRGLEFVTRKITWHAAALRLGLVSELRLGNLEAQRDWGYAKDYVEAMWMMLQNEQPQDYVIATGVGHTVRRCLEIAFDQAGLPIDDRVVIDESLTRPAEVDHLIGDASKAKSELGWEPRTNFEQLIRLMVDADHKLLSRGMA